MSRQIRPTGQEQKKYQRQQHAFAAEHRGELPPRVARILTTTAQSIMSRAPPAPTTGPHGRPAPRQEDRNHTQHRANRRPATSPFAVATWSFRASNRKSVDDAFAAV
jgi:hypothetical protein